MNFEDLLKLLEKGEGIANPISGIIGGASGVLNMLGIGRKKQIRQQKEMAENAARFYQSCNILQGIHQLKGRQDEPLIIIKSYKDVMAFDIFNIAAVAPMSESILISDEVFKDLYNRFSDIHVVFDNDEAGKACAIS